MKFSQIVGNSSAVGWWCDVDEVAEENPERVYSSWTRDTSDRLLANAVPGMRWIIGLRRFFDAEPVGATL